MLFDYDDTNIDSIFEYAKKLEGMTFQQVIEEYYRSPKNFYVNPAYTGDETSDYLGPYDATLPSKEAKGQLGNILEQYYFGYKLNGSQQADFSKAGAELKLTCINQKKNGEYAAGERLSITNISYKEPVEDNFYLSHVWNKIAKILLIHYLRDKSKDRFDYPIKYVNLFTPPQEDLAIIIQDYLKIISKIKDGKAHEISESDTLYLGACTKGATAEKSTVQQYYGDKTPAKKRNFCFKRQYMDYVLNHYILKKTESAESILKLNTFNQNKSFEELILDMINMHAGKTDKELCELYGREYNKNKAQWSDLAYKMLGIKGNHAEEFIKANIVVKSIRIEQNGTMKESISLPPFSFKKLVTEVFDESEFCEYFEETKFLFVVYKSNGTNYVLQGAQLWNMPSSDLYGDAQIGWQCIHEKIQNGIHFKIKENRVMNDLPSKSDNRILHIRPHAAKAAYKLNNGYMIGDIQKNANQLPNGEWMTTQSFWLNNTYILSQLEYR